MPRKFRVHLFADLMDFQRDFEHSQKVWTRAVGDYNNAHPDEEPIELLFTGEEYLDLRDKIFDLLLFDYGGLSTMPGVSELPTSFSREIIEDAEEHPSRSYVMISMFTKTAIEDFLEDTGGSLPPNVYTDEVDLIRDFIAQRVVLA